MLRNKSIEYDQDMTIKTKLIIYAIIISLITKRDNYETTWELINLFGCQNNR